MDDVKVLCHSRVQAALTDAGQGPRYVNPPLHLTNACRFHNWQHKIFGTAATVVILNKCRSRSLAHSFIRKFLTCVLTFVVHFPTLLVSRLYCADSSCMNLNLGIAGNVIDRVNRRSGGKKPVPMPLYIGVKG
jgi:hypothetical protein